MRKFLLFLVAFIAIFGFQSNDVVWAKPMTSMMKQDVDGDKKPDTFIYTLEETKEGFKCSLTITSAKGKELWVHPWMMTKDDLIKNTLFHEGKISINTWVDQFFTGKLIYGAKYKTTKLKPNDLQDTWINFYAEKNNLESDELKKRILSSKKNTTFFYRATWREDVVILVYVPSLGKFVGYSGGEY